ncbi:hypothetical protein GC173_01365 [bacterium]|nr:hypothetical protein [bacterium]
MRIGEAFQTVAFALLLAGLVALPTQRVAGQRMVDSSAGTTPSTQVAQSSERTIEVYDPMQAKAPVAGTEQVPPRALGRSTSEPLTAQVRQAASLEVNESAGLFVGVSQFLENGQPSTSIAAIPYAVDDAVDLAWTFSQRLALVPASNVVVAITGEPVKADSRGRLAEIKAAGGRVIPATAIGVQTEALSLSSKTGKNGIFVMSIATHGFSDRGDWLLAQDTNLALLQGTSIPLSTLEDIASRAGAPRRFIMIDACRERLSSSSRSLGSVDKAMTESFAKAFSQASGTAVLMGTTLGGFSFDDTTRQNGVFTSAILDGVGGMASPDQQGLITVAGLRDFVDAQVRDWVRKNRPDQAGSSTGISSRTDDSRAATIPLAINPNATQLYAEQRERIDKALATMLDVGKLHPELITGALVDEVRKSFGRLEGTNREKVLIRIERLRDADAVDVEMFAGWWVTFSKQLEGAKSVAGQVVEPVEVSEAVPKNETKATGKASPYRTIVTANMGFQLELEPIRIEAVNKRVQAEMKGDAVLLRNLGVTGDDMALKSTGEVFLLMKRPLDGGFSVMDDAYDVYMDVVGQYVKPVNPDVKNEGQAWCKTFQVANDSPELAYQRILITDQFVGTFGVPNVEVYGARFVINRHRHNGYKASVYYSDQVVVEIPNAGVAAGSIKELMKVGRQSFRTDRFSDGYQDGFFEILFENAPGQFQLLDESRRSVGTVMPASKQVSQIQLPWLE